MNFKQILNIDSPQVPNPLLSELRPLLNFTAYYILPDHFMVIIISASQKVSTITQHHKDRVRRIKK